MQLVQLRAAHPPAGCAGPNHHPPAGTSMCVATKCDTTARLVISPLVVTHTCANPCSIPTVGVGVMSASCAGSLSLPSVC